jgi:mannitol/fructose-specific phosphotransferase system IIA component
MTEILSLETIKIGAVIETKEEAIRTAGELLVNAGRVMPSYVLGMLEREKTMSTLIGNGVAIPHGQFGDLQSVLASGISVLQIPEGVLWDNEDKAFLVVGIASQHDDHISILQNLAEVVDDEETVKLLSTTSDPHVILDYLNKEVTE